MSLVWVAFVLIIGRILATSTLFADRFASATRRPRRFIWAAGLVFTTAWPIVAFGALGIVRGAAAHGIAMNSPSGGLPLKFYLPRVVAPAWIDQTFLILWAGASTILVARLTVGLSIVRRWRRTLAVIDVDGVSARLSPSAGPAVVGFCTTELMIPPWVLTLEPSARSLIIRHEEEHAATNDPRLLLLAALLPALVPWNIFSWWQASRLRLAIEIDCDDRVLRNAPGVAAYAALLVQIAERSSRTASLPTMVPALIGSPHRLSQRLAAIRERQTTTRVILRIGYAVIAAVAFTAALAIETPLSPWMRAALRSSTHGHFVRRARSGH